jgi:arsenate reductase-like glutaredoxin family protein
MKLYTYQACSTCKAAVKWLRSRGIAFDEIPIRETPPTLAELRAMLAAHSGELRPLFNTSGLDYRALGLKDKLPDDHRRGFKTTRHHRQPREAPLRHRHEARHPPHRLPGGRMGRRARLITSRRALAASVSLNSAPSVRR